MISFKKTSATTETWLTNGSFGATYRKGQYFGTMDFETNTFNVDGYSILHVKVNVKQTDTSVSDSAFKISVNGKSESIKPTGTELEYVKTFDIKDIDTTKVQFYVQAGNANSVNTVQGNVLEIWLAR